MRYESGSPVPTRAHRQWTPLARALAAMGDRWTLLIVLALDDGTLRLSALRERLPGVSSGVLDHHLNEMVATGLLSRQRFREMPPRVELDLTERGRELLPIAASLARWGMRNGWPEPQNREHVRADAVLRQLPALLEDASDLPDGTVEAVVGTGNGDAGDDTRQWFEIVGGQVRAATEVNAATARIEGDEQAWIAALGPARDYSGLRLAGESAIAKRLLDSLPRG
jgi:DNA-binding HxlR family transcriptional regulator